MKHSSVSNPSLVFLWAVPRSVSTAFEKAMSQHPQVITAHEPLTKSYYFSNARFSSRYGLPAKIEPPLILDLHSINRFISPKRITFVKELAFQGNPYVSDDCLKISRHLIILRKPKTVYRSLVKIKPDFTEDEFGFTALSRLISRLNRLNCPPLAIYDGDNFRFEPEVVLRKTCALIGIEFCLAMLSWESGKIRSWTPDEALSQACWHKTLEHSTTILPPDTHNSHVTVRLEHRSIVKRATAIYHQCHPSQPH